MSVGINVITALKAVGKWVVQNQDIVIDAADKVMKFKTEDKVEQLGAAVLELEKKIDMEMDAVNKQLRDMKIVLSIMTVLLIVAIITIILLII